MKKVKIEGDYDDLPTLTRLELQEMANIIRILQPYEAASKEFSGLS